SNLFNKKSNDVKSMVSSLNEEQTSKEEMDNLEEAEANAFASLDLNEEKLNVDEKKNDTDNLLQNIKTSVGKVDVACMGNGINSCKKCTSCGEKLYIVKGVCPKCGTSIPE
ncbi:MAG: hypothetical protein RR659_01465, partial [Bacilli bacterium]